MVLFSKSNYFRNKNNAKQFGESKNTAVKAYMCVYIPGLPRLKRRIEIPNARLPSETPFSPHATLASGETPDARRRRPDGASHTRISEYSRNRDYVLILAVDF